ncbi:MAG TPA: c-type cytochrome [Stellaceae bacterium]|nr:c-type cytochrome [Stellaceae bacterium]
MTRFLPYTASTLSHEVNWLYLGLLIIAFCVLLLVVGMMATFCVRYRRASATVRGGPVKSFRFEIAWTSATFLGFIGLFFWGAFVYLDARTPPRDAVPIYVLGKQWMWKVEHPGGQSEINTLHVPIGRPIRLVLASQDVIHDFFVPAFRVKYDVVPGRYEDLWFEAITVGRYPFFCSQLCGTFHADMRGWVVTMEPADFAKWLAAQGPSESLALQGKALFHQYGCSGCHEPRSTIHAPLLAGLYGRPVALQGGGFIIADEAYIRDQILMNKHIPAGYPPKMPHFAGHISEEDVLKLIAYIKSLASAPGSAR